MIPWQPSVVEGRIARLEPLSPPTHLEGLWAASRDARTWQWMPVTLPDRPSLEALVTGAAAASGTTEIPYATVARSTGRIVGSTRFLALRPEHRSLEIGWTWLHPDAWGTGVNAEAKLLLLGQAFVGWGCRRVEFKTDARNERSRAALEAIGATFEGVHRNHMLVRGGVSRDSAWYSVLDDEWPDVRARLQARVDGYPAASARE